MNLPVAFSVIFSGLAGSFVRYRQREITGVFRNPDIQVHAAFRQFCHPDQDFAFIGESGLHVHPGAAGFEGDRTFIGNEEVHVQGRILQIHGIDILAERGQSPGNVGRAACYAEPLLADIFHMTHGSGRQAGRRPDLQGIYIEETLSVQRNSSKHSIIKGFLHNIHISGFSADLIHAQPEHGKADRSAALTVTAVIGQVIVRGKALQMAGGTDSAREIHAFFHDIIPENLTGSFQAFIFTGFSQVRHGAVQIHGAHRMSFRCLLFPDRQMGLGILRRIIPELRKDPLKAGTCQLLHEIVFPHAASVNKILCLLQIFLFSCHLVKLDQADLDLFMAGIPVNFTFLCSECIDDQVRKAAHAVKEFSFSGPEIIGDGGLHQMAGGIQFVPLAQIAPSSFRIRQGIEGIDISVAALGFRDQIDHFVGCFFQLLILIIRQGKSDRFQPFGCIGILERRPVKSPGGPAGGDPEVFQAVAGLGIADPVIDGVPLIGNNRFPHQINMFGPEGIPDRDSSRVQRLQSHMNLHSAAG